MPEEETVETIGKLAWDNRKVILKALGAITKWFRGDKSQKGILILGPGGTGKTTLARLLAGEFDSALAIPGEYQESLEIESFKLKGSKIEVVVPPGQEFRRDATWTELCKDVEAGKYRGIILLSAYGYHSLSGISYKEHRLFSTNKTTAQFVKAYLRERREAEVAILRKIAIHVRVNRHPMWLLSVIAKQDLWIPEAEKVRKHYADTAGEYGSVAQELAANKDAAQFRHETVLASLTLNNFKSGVGEVLKRTASGYDLPKHVESRRRLFESVDALKNWELR